MFGNCFAAMGRFGFYRGGGGIMMFIFWLFIAGVMAYTIYSLINKAPARNNGRNEGKAENNPAEIARIRYARGEIDKEEFNQIIEDLDGNR